MLNTTYQPNSRRSSYTSTYVLGTAGQIRLEPLEGSTVNAEAYLKPLQQDVMVDRVKRSRKIQQDQCCVVFAVDS